MPFLEKIQNRYTTKKYDASKKIDTETIEALKTVLQLSPSSINCQPWKFTFISNENLKNELAEVSRHNLEKIKEASHLVVFNVVDNLEKFETQISEYLPEFAVGYYKQFQKPKPESEIKSWLTNQVYLSLGFFLAACPNFGVDATPMEGIEAELYDKILKNKDYKAVFAVAIGFRDPNDANQPTQKPKSRLPIDKVVESI